MTDHLVAVLGDLHFGKITQYGYDLDEASRRLREFPVRLRGLKGKTHSDIWFLLVGDMLDGTAIFDHQDAQTQAGVMEQKRRFVRAASAMLHKTRKTFPRTKIHVRAVPGNHGRINRTGDPINNFDTDALETLGLACPEYDFRISHYISDVVNIGGARIAMMHRAERHANTHALRNRIRNRLEFYDADFLVAGHWHTPQVFTTDAKKPIYAITGSMCGTDEYAEQLGLFSPPWQLVFMVRDGEIFGFDWVKYDKKAI